MGQATMDMMSLDEMEAAMRWAWGYMDGNEEQRRKTAMQDCFGIAPLTAVMLLMDIGDGSTGRTGASTYSRLVSKGYLYDIPFKEVEQPTAELTSMAIINRQGISISEPFKKLIKHHHSMARLAIGELGAAEQADFIMLLRDIHEEGLTPNEVCAFLNGCEFVSKCCHYRLLAPPWKPAQKISDMMGASRPSSFIYGPQERLALMSHAINDDGDDTFMNCALDELTIGEMDMLDKMSLPGYVDIIRHRVRNNKNRGADLKSAARELKNDINGAFYRWADHVGEMGTNASACGLTFSRDAVTVSFLPEWTLPEVHEREFVKTCCARGSGMSVKYNFKRGTEW